MTRSGVYKILFLCFILNKADAQRIELDPFILSNYDTMQQPGIDIIPFVEVFVDSSRRLDYEIVKNKTFSPFNRKLHDPYDWKYNYWYRIKIINPSTNNLSAGFKLDVNTVWVTVIQEFPFNKTVSGPGLALAERDYKEEAYYLPFNLKGRDSATYYILMERNHGLKAPYLRIESEKQRVLNINNRLLTHRGYIMVLSIYLILWFLMIIICLIQYFIFNRHALFWYSIYLAFNLLFFLRNFESYYYQKIFTYYIGHFSRVEPTLNYSSTIMYLIFVREFLKGIPGTEVYIKYFFNAARVFTAILVVDLLVVFAFGPIGSQELFIHIRPVFLILYPWALVILFKYRKKTEISLIFIGSLILYLGIVLTAVEQLLNWEKVQLYAGIIRLYVVNGFPIYYFQMPTCITIELFCFTIAVHILVYRERKEFMDQRIDNQKDKNRLADIESEIQSLEHIKSLWENEIVLLKSSQEANLDLIKSYEEKISHLNESLKKTAQTQLIASAEKTSGSSEFYERGRDIVQKKLADNSFKTEDWAEAMFLSRSQFSNRWKQEAGMAPSVYLQQSRLLRGKKLLELEEYTISRVAAECGFSDHAHFSRQFKEYFQMTPNEYRLALKSLAQKPKNDTDLQENDTNLQGKRLDNQ